ALSCPRAARRRGRGRRAASSRALPRGLVAARRRLPLRLVRCARVRRRHLDRGRVPGVPGGPGRRAPFRSGLLPAWPGAVEEAQGPDDVFPRLTLDDWRESLFRIGWQQHGGSGLRVSRGEALEMDVSERDWLLERIDSEREREAKAIEQASKGK